jgi:hypothetical protein
MDQLGNRVEMGGGGDWMPHLFLQQASGQMFKDIVKVFSRPRIFILICLMKESIIHPWQK